MSLGWLIYVVTRLDALCIFSILAAVIFTIVTATLSVVYVVDKIDGYEGEEKRWKPFLKLSGFVTVIFIIMAIFLPTSKEAAAIYLIPKIVQNEDVQKIPSNAVKFLNIKLEEWLRDVKVDKEKK